MRSDKEKEKQQKRDEKEKNKREKKELKLKEKELRKSSKIEGTEMINQFTSFNQSISPRVNNTFASLSNSSNQLNQNNNLNQQNNVVSSNTSFIQIKQPTPQIKSNQNEIQIQYENKTEKIDTVVKTPSPQQIETKPTSSFSSLSNSSSNTNNLNNSNTLNTSINSLQSPLPNENNRIKKALPPIPGSNVTHSFERKLFSPSSHSQYQQQLSLNSNSISPNEIIPSKESNNNVNNNTNNNSKQQPESTTSPTEINNQIKRPRTNSLKNSKEQPLTSLPPKSFSSFFRRKTPEIVEDNESKQQSKSLSNSNSSTPNPDFNKRPPSPATDRSNLSSQLLQRINETENQSQPTQPNTFASLSQSGPTPPQNESKMKRISANLLDKWRSFKKDKK